MAEGLKFIIMKVYNNVLTKICMKWKKISLTTNEVQGEKLGMLRILGHHGYHLIKVSNHWRGRKDVAKRMRLWAAATRFRKIIVSLASAST